MAENFERVRAGFEAFNRRDLDALLALFHCDGQLHELADVPDARVYYGHEGVREWLGVATSTFSDLRFEPRELTQHGDVVIAKALATAKGAGSGIPLSYEVFFVFTMRDGRAVRAEGYLDRARALEAGGLGDRTS